MERGEGREETEGWHATAIGPEELIVTVHKHFVHIAHIYCSLTTTQGDAPSQKIAVCLAPLSAPSPRLSFPQRLPARAHNE